MPNLVDLDAMFQQRVLERDRLRAQIDAIDADLAAIDRLRSFVPGFGTSMSPPPARPPTSLDPAPDDDDEDAGDRRHLLTGDLGGEWPGLRGAIRNAIREHDGMTFTLDDVAAYIELHYPQRDVKRVHVSGELWRMNKQKAIRVVEEGGGTKPNVYAKGGDQPPEGDAVNKL